MVGFEPWPQKNGDCFKVILQLLYQGTENAGTMQDTRVARAQRKAQGRKFENRHRRRLFWPFFVFKILAIMLIYHVPTLFLVCKNIYVMWQIAIGGVYCTFTSGI